MGGTSRTEQTTNQSSTTNPWAPSQGLLTGILGQLNSGLANTGITGAENSAIDRFSSTAGRGNPYQGLMGNFAGELLNGGGATNQTGAINQNFAEYQRRLNPIADGQNIGPNGNPALAGYLDRNANDIQTRINGMFAGAGRDLSGANVIQAARGITEGNAPILAGQYNIDANNQRSAADALYGAGNTNAGLLSGLQQQALQNKQVGTGVAQGLYDSSLSNARAGIEAEALRRGIPMQNLGLLANIGIPIAGLGGQSTGQSTQRGSQQMSGAQQFSTLVTPFTNMFRFGGGGGG